MKFDNPKDVFNPIKPWGAIWPPLVNIAPEQKFGPGFWHQHLSSGNINNIYIQGFFENATSRGTKRLVAPSF